MVTPQGSHDFIRPFVLSFFLALPLTILLHSYFACFLNGVTRVTGCVFHRVSHFPHETRRPELERQGPDPALSKRLV